MFSKSVMDFKENNSSLSKTLTSESYNEVSGEYLHLRFEIKQRH